MRETHKPRECFGECPEHRSARDMQETQGFARLRRVQEQMIASGARDVKFTWGPDAHKMEPDVLANQVAEFLEAFLNGKYKVIFDTRETSTTWTCGCGHVNGCNLAWCSMCYRRPNGRHKDE